MNIRVSMNITPERAAMALIRALYKPEVSQDELIRGIHRTSVRRLVSTIKTVTEEGGRNALDALPDGFNCPSAMTHAIEHATALISTPAADAQAVPG